MIRSIRRSFALFLLMMSMPLATAANVPVVFENSGTVPVTASGYTASGNTVEIQLNFAPAAGTDLTVVRNTSSAFIQGTFDNLAQGQAVNLTYAGVIYSFAANYYGGSGNDLVLQWANHRLAAWGRGVEGQLGNGGNTNALVPVAVDVTGNLAGKAVLAGATGYQRNLMLCSDGTLLAWGSTNIGAAGMPSSKVPVAVDQSGVLAGKTVVAVSCGYNHSLALCSDGTLAAWGLNANGQFGTGNTTASNAPVLVNRSGVLAGKDIVAIGAGNSFSVALCSDGTLATWGGNVFGQLGNNSTTDSTSPVLVNTAGVLAGRTPAAIAVGGSHTLALCTDGALVAWGGNFSGQLGNNSTTQPNVPVLVTASGTALAGKTIASLVAGSRASYALCSDNTLAVWGDNSFGQLGLGDTTNRLTAAAVPKSGVLTGKTVTSIAAGYNMARVHCSDGALVTWGNNQEGQLGNNSTTSSNSPVLATTSLLLSGERFAGGYQGSEGYYHIARIASPPPAIAATAAATAVSDSGAVLNGSVNPNLTSVSVTFQYGLTRSYGSTAAATPSALSGNATTAVAATIGGLLPATTYHYRVVATSASGSAYGEDRTFTTTDFATLSGLALSGRSIAPAFSSLIENYDAAVTFAFIRVNVIPVTTHAGATVRVNGVTVDSGTASGLIPLAVGANPIQVVVDANDGINTKTYTIVVTRLPDVFRFTSASTVPVTVDDFEPTGLIAPGFELGFAPAPGTTLTVVQNTGYGPIRGTFGYLGQGQLVRLTYAGISYDFVANYFGGSGNDLVLHWAHTRLLGWGINTGSQLGTGEPPTTNSKIVPTPVLMSGALAGKTVVAIATRLNDSLALCADGTLATWGSASTTPLLVNSTGALTGKTPVAVAAGDNHFLVLCSDGTLAAWGTNTYGQLGNNSTISSTTPVAVDQSGVLAGKTPVAIAASEWFSLVLCSDGTVAGWGSNNHGRLGDGTTDQRRVPVLVNTSTALAGKRVVAIACGYQHSLALCSDGTLAAWGNNHAGQLGNNTTTVSSVPVAVVQSGVLNGKTVVQIDAGQYHNLVRCSDGTLYTWGENTAGQLGNNTTTNSSVPVAVVQSGVLNGKTVRAITSGLRHNLALCSDGSIGSWGYNFYGTLGNATTTNSSVPVLVSTAMLRTGERFTTSFSDCQAFYSFALAASLPPPTVTTLAASSVQQTSAVLNATVNAASASTTVTFEYGSTTTYGSTVAAVPGTVTGTNTTAVSATLSGLVAGTPMHYRVKATNANGTATGADLTFTPSRPPVFSGYAIATAYQTAALISPAKLLAKASDPDGNVLNVSSAGPGSSRGGTAALQADGIRYTPPAGFSGTDTFAVTIRDTGGAIVTGTVTVTVGPASNAGGATLNPPKITRLASGVNELKFHGIPNRTYQLQRSTDLTNWIDLATVTAAENGAIFFTDKSPPPGSGFYRLRKL